MTIELIADHTHFLVINKPPGLPCHRDEGEDGVLDLLRAETTYADLYLVHRLDKATSGLMVLAKSAEAASEFGVRFATRTVKKFYLAVSDRPAKKKQGTISGDMVAARNGAWKLLPTRDNPAVTQFFSAGTGDGGRLFLVHPLTGRTHQIRVALKALGSPILGDDRYGGAAADRMYLHAYALAFDLDGESYHFQCPPSVGQYWQRDGTVAALNKFAVPWSMSWPGA